MALRAVPEHPKFADLKKALGLPKGAVLGWLEAVWHFAGRFTPRGDLGKYQDSQIESWVEWDAAVRIAMLKLSHGYKLFRREQESSLKDDLRASLEAEEQPIF